MSMTPEEWKAMLKEAFPDEVSGYKRGDTVPCDAPFMTEFPPFISKDLVIYKLTNFIIRQMLSNDKILDEGYKSADEAIKALITALTSKVDTQAGASHTLTLQGDVTGSTTFTNKSNITVSTSVKSIKRGMIMMWYGNVNDVPNGWAICNGSNGTPDLRDRFVIGAGSNYGLGWTGGETSHTLSVNEMPSHQHISPWGECGGFDPPWGKYGNADLYGSGDSDDDNYWGYTSPTGGGQAHNNMPPYYGLYFIMKL